MQRPRISGVLLAVSLMIAGVAISVTTGSCGGGGGGGSIGSGTTGTVTVRLSDPPICSAPVGEIVSVWVTVTKVRAHLDPAAPEGAAGWVDLVDLTDNPLQVDLMSMDSTECFLATLGSTTGLPAGNYQQIRIHLLSNNPTGGTTTPTPNHCAGTGGFNCVDHATEGLSMLLLSSQAINGIKIPPGQIAGGGIMLEEDQAADINIDFDACRSIIQQGNGMFRLKPTLHAGEVSVNNSAVTGRIVDSVTGAPIAGATIIVMAEQPDSAGVDRVVAQTLASSTDGTFLLCPLPEGDYDFVVSAMAPSGAVSGPTVLFDVPVGTNIGDIPVVLTAGAVTSAGQLMGTVTTTDPALMPTSADVVVTALQSATPPGGSALLVTVPMFPGSTSNVTTEPGATCPAGTACATYTLIVAASNPSVGLFSSGGTTFSAPAAPPVLFTVEAEAFLPDGSGNPDCSPSVLTTTLDMAAMPLAAVPGITTTVQTLAFTMCTAGF